MPHFTASDGTSIYYTDEGEGLPVLALSGLTRNSTDFDFVAPYLTGYRLIRMDYRGRGKSDWCEDFSQYAVPVEARDAVELLDHLGLDKAAILGTSRGGLIGMFLAATAKDRLLGVALNDVGPQLDLAGLRIIADYVGRRPSWKTLDEAAEKRPATAPEFANVPASRWREEVERLYVEKDDGLHLTYDPKLREAISGLDADEQPDLWPLFDALADLPIACIRGANSDLLSEDAFEEMKRRRPDMITVVVPDRGHIPFLDEPESLEALNKWLDELR